MQTGVISFCDRVGHNIKSNESKDVILRTLEACFKIKIIQRQWHRLEEESLVHLQRSPHLLCLRSNGNPYYMYFTRYDDVPQIFFIDKKIQPGYYYPRIILGKGMFDEALFDNTLLDGEMVKNNDKKWVFLVNDVIAYKGRHLENMGLLQRLALAFTMFEESYNQHNVCDLCLFRVKKYFPASTQGLDDMMALADKLNYTNRGLYFWPTHLRYKPKLHNFDDTLIKTVNHKIKDNAEFRSLPSAGGQSQFVKPAQAAAPAQQPVPFVKPVPSPSHSPAQHAQAQPQPVPFVKPGESTMWLRKTEHPDVYDVYRTDNGQGKLGTTYIQSLATSKKIRDVFKELTLAVSVQFKCVFNEKFQKWAPCI